MARAIVYPHKLRRWHAGHDAKHPDLDCGLCREAGWFVPQPSPKEKLMPIESSYCVRDLTELRRRREELLAQDDATYVSGFEDLMTDTMVGIAHGAQDDPQEMARELLRLGAVIYGSPEMWLTWPGAEPEGGQRRG